MQIQTARILKCCIGPLISYDGKIVDSFSAGQASLVRCSLLEEMLASCFYTSLGPILTFLGTETFLPVLKERLQAITAKVVGDRRIVSVGLRIFEDVIPLFVFPIKSERKSSGPSRFLIVSDVTSCCIAKILY